MPKFLTMTTTYQECSGSRRLGRCSPLLACGLLAIWLGPGAGPVTAGDESSGQKGKTAPTESQMDQARLLNRAIAFRNAARKDLAAAGKQFGCRGPMELITKGKLHKANPDAWRMFFGGAVVLIGNPSGEMPVAGFYNPFFDAVVLTNWKNDGEKSRPTSLAIRQGCDLEGTKLQPDGTPMVARWLAGRAAGPVGLARQYQEFIKDFEAEFPPTGKRSVTIEPGDKQSLIQDLVEEHMRISYAFLETMHGGAWAPVGNYVRTVKTLMTQGKSKALAPYLPKDNLMTAQQLVALPKTIRANLAPQYCLLSEDAVVVFLTSSSAPAYYGMVEFDLKFEGKSTDVVPRSIVFCDLAKLLP